MSVHNGCDGATRTTVESQKCYLLIERRMKGHILNVQKEESLEKKSLLACIFKKICLQGLFQPTAHSLSPKSLPVSRNSGNPIVIMYAS